MPASQPNSSPQRPVANEVTAPRRVGSDQAFWWLIDQNHPVHVALVAEVTGPTAVDAWSLALGEIQRRHPNLCGRIIRGEDSHLWFHRVADAPIPLRVVKANPAAWETELAREMTTRMDLGRAPLARATLIHAANRSTLILAMHHAIADAKSILFAIRDVLAALSGQSLAPLAPKPSLTSLLFQEPAARNDAAVDTPPPAAFGEPDIFRSFDGETPIIARRTLSPSLTGTLRQRCRDEKTTVHGALVTATVAAARQVSAKLKQAPIEVISPSDMRSLLGAEEDVAPLAGGASMTMAASTEHEGFWETARLVRRNLVPPRTPDELKSSFAMMQQFMARQPDLQETITFLAGRGGEKISVNNLGAVPFESRFSELTLQAIWGPCLLLGYEAERLISAATVEGSLHLTHTSYQPLPGVLEVMEQHLAAACTS
jgi:Condensation domain